MQKITPFLWFDDQAKEAVDFYTSIFPNSSVTTVTYYSAEGALASGRKEGSVMTVAFSLEDQDFTAINGGPVFKFTPAISFVVNCETQDEIDHFWNKLSAKKEAEQCGWLMDKYGVSWQIIPSILEELMSDPVKSVAVMKAVLQMKKLDINALQQAYDEA